MKLPAVMSSKKCWERYTRENATTKAIKKKKIREETFSDKKLKQKNKAKAEVACPEGKLLCMCCDSTRSGTTCKGTSIFSK
jgi:hypothetical protein